MRRYVGLLAANLTADPTPAVIQQVRYLILFISGFTHLFDTVGFLTGLVLISKFHRWRASCVGWGARKHLTHLCITLLHFKI